MPMFKSQGNSFLLVYPYLKVKRITIYTYLVIWYENLKSYLLRHSSMAMSYYYYFKMTNGTN